MKKLIIVLLAGLLLATAVPAISSTSTLTAQNLAAAIASVDSFTELLNQEALVAAYYSGSEFLQLSASETEWVDKTRRAHQLLGGVKVRKVVKARMKTSHPSLPDDNYLLVYSEVEMDRKKAGHEVTVLRVENGLWKVCDYSVK